MYISQEFNEKFWKLCEMIANFAQIMQELSKVYLFSCKISCWKTLHDFHSKNSVLDRAFSNTFFLTIGKMGMGILCSGVFILFFFAYFFPFLMQNQVPQIIIGLGYVIYRFKGFSVLT